MVYTTVRRTARLVMAAVLILITSCSRPNPEPASWPADATTGRPAIDWPRGAPDLSSVWVNALRDSFISRALANNEADYSGAYLAQYNTPEIIAQDAWAMTEFLDGSNESEMSIYFAPGPAPHLVQDVRTTGQSAEITVCLAQQWQVYPPSSFLSSVPPVESLESGSGREIVYTMTRDNASQTPQLSSIHDQLKSCELADLGPGYFNPQPDYSRLVSRDDVVGPDGSQPYVP